MTGEERRNISRADTEQLLRRFVPARAASGFLDALQQQQQQQQPAQQPHNRCGNAQQQPAPPSAAGDLVSRIAQTLVPSLCNSRVGQGMSALVRAACSGLPQVLCLSQNWTLDFLDPSLETHFRHFYNSTLQALDEVHVLLLFVLVVARLVLVASGHPFTRVDFLMYCAPLLFAGLGPLLNGMDPQHYLPVRPLVLIVLRAAAVLFSTVCAVNEVEVAPPDGLPGAAPTSGVLLLLSWAMLHPVEFRHHVPAQLLSLSIVLGGNALLYQRLGAAGTHSLGLPPLPSLLVQQYLFGFLLPTVLLYLLERAVRQQYLWHIKTGSVRIFKGKAA